ncbi:UNVERIFIED_CONTAM: hypothetical protein Sangu_2641700 [Sesamum angustifolium]|uniref:Uncharacterized protein n=1 Tax=Sesamum angustifolium TaxID=2727405 RepID=A0AAW2J4Z1_9LAMI
MREIIPATSSSNVPCSPVTLHALQELPDGMQPGELDMSENFGLITVRAKHRMAIPRYRLHQ